jgi:ubiquitin-like 1-activating enzyme E1 A
VEERWEKKEEKTRRALFSSDLLPIPSHAHAPALPSPLPHSLSTARVVLIGSGCLAAEIGKNLALAGVGRLVLVDEGGSGASTTTTSPASAAARGNFLIGCAPPAGAPGALQPPSAAAVAAAALKEMNPHVGVSFLEGGLPSLCPPPSPASPPPAAAAASALASAFAGASAVILAGAWRGGAGGAAAALAADAAASEAGAAFFWAGVAGPAGWCFADLGPAFAFAPSAAEAATTQAAALAGGGGGGEAGGGAPPQAPPPPPPLTRLPFPPLHRALAHPWAGLHPRRTHGLVTALRVAADFEASEGRGVGDGDEGALAARAAAVASADGVAPHAAPTLLAAAAPLLHALVAGDPDTPAVAAVVGGEAGHEVVKALTRKGRPARNLFCFDLRDGKGGIEFLGGVGEGEAEQVGAAAEVV